MNLKKAVKTARTAGKAVKIIRTATKNPYLTGLALGAAVCAADQLFKAGIEQQPAGTFPHDAAESGVGAKIEFDRRHNSGIAMEKLSKNPQAVKALTTFGMSAAVLDLLSRKKSDTAGIIGDCLALGGAASNALDRATRGYVVDYLHLKKGPLSKIVFNLGDVAIAAGTAVSAAGRAIRRD